MCLVAHNVLLHGLLLSMFIGCGCAHDHVGRGAHVCAGYQRLPMVVPTLHSLMSQVWACWGHERKFLWLS